MNTLFVAGQTARLDAIAPPSNSPQVVWDYALLNGTHSDYTLYGNTTY